MHGRLAYVSHPYRDPDIHKIISNINSAESFAKFVYDAGWHPITPHSLTPAIFGTICDDEEGIVDYHKSLMDAASIMFVCGNVITPGMQVEIDYCEKVGKPWEQINKNVPIKTYNHDTISNGVRGL